jgi:hypothetical protein
MAVLDLPQGVKAGTRASVPDFDCRLPTKPPERSTVFSQPRSEFVAVWRIDLLCVAGVQCCAFIPRYAIHRIHMSEKSPTRAYAEPPVTGLFKRALRPFPVNLPSRGAALSAAMGNRRPCATPPTHANGERPERRPIMIHAVTKGGRKTGAS